MTAWRILALLSFLGICTTAEAEEPSVGDIIASLTPTAEYTRSLRGISVEPSKKPKAPSIDIRLQFAYDSDNLDTEAVLSLKNLGRALSHPKLQSYTFQILGHTDAKGSDVYNLQLSERRAKAVYEHLIFYYDIDKERLASVGLGETQLFDAANPEADINRRVEIKTIVK